jgi:hypothetical protein
MKRYRTDLVRWEEKKYFLWIIPYYKYTIFNRSPEYTLFKRGDTDYFDFLPDITPKEVIEEANKKAHDTSRNK